MPFDLEKTLHTFSNLPSGGDQTVTVRDISDVAQIKLIREHLSQIAVAFSAGNFSDPSTIHGSSMPGLSVLSANPDKFSIKYLNVTGGATLEYRSTNPDIISAIHAWFAAQLLDHGSDAMEGHAGAMSGMSSEMICAHHPDTCATNTVSK